MNRSLVASVDSNYVSLNCNKPIMTPPLKAEAVTDILRACKNLNIPMFSLN